jgi:hypothetical protein
MAKSEYGEFGLGVWVDRFSACDEDCNCGPDDLDREEGADCLHQTTTALPGILCLWATQVRGIRACAIKHLRIVERHGYCRGLGSRPDFGRYGRPVVDGEFVLSATWPRSAARSIPIARSIGCQHPSCAAFTSRQTESSGWGICIFPSIRRKSGSRA